MKSFFVYSLLCLTIAAHAQSIKPGFDKEEYHKLMLISVQTTGNQEYISNFLRPENHSILYQSQPVALDNLWDMWVHNRGENAVISIRGTTEKTESWLLNFYAAMVPAKGSLSWGDDHTFEYHLSDDPRAAVHTGWLVGMAFMAGDIVEKINYLYNEGISDFYIVGHSQGGGIAYLLSSHLSHLKETGELPSEIQFKTYCSAAPKPGNLYYAYSFESQFQNGWAFSIVNAADWVPEVPITIQTLDDFNETNPFVNAEEVIAQQKLTTRIALKRVYKKLNKPTRKAQKNYQRYLGDEAHKMVTEKIDGLKVPEYLPTSNYVRTGTHIILQPDEAYFQAFPNDSNDVFTHHTHRPYLYLTEKLETPFYQQEEAPKPNEMKTSEWVLSAWNGEEGKKADLETYRPTLQLMTEEGRIAGYTGCNRFNGEAKYDGSSIRISKNMMMTKRACKDFDEQAFTKDLAGVTTFFVSENGETMLLLKDKSIVMEFKKGTVE